MASLQIVSCGTKKEIENRTEENSLRKRIQYNGMSKLLTDTFRVHLLQKTISYTKVKTLNF